MNNSIFKDFKKSIEPLKLNKLTKKKMLITGGTGWFGKWLLQTIIYLNKNHNFKISAYIPTRSVEKFKNEYPEIYYHDFLNFFNYDVNSSTLDCEKCDFIIHSAVSADSKLYKEQPLLISDTIVNGTKNILDFAVKNNPEKFLFISSGAVYGKQPYDMSNIPESYINCKMDILNPLNVYHEAKRYAEQLCAIYIKQFGLNITIARPFTFFGPYQNLDTPFAITDFIKNCIAGQDIEILSDGSTVRSYMYAADLPMWLFKILLDGKVNEAYNIGSNASITIKDLAENIVKLFNPKLKVVIKGEKISKEKVNIYVPAINKAINELGLRLSFNFEKGLKRTYEWYKSFLVI